MSTPFVPISGTLTTPWRGSTFPDNPLSGQLFFLDVPNGNDPPRGWYQWLHGLIGHGGPWQYVARDPADRGDLVRPVTEFKVR